MKPTTIPTEAKPRIIEQVVYLPGEVYRTKFNIIISDEPRTCLSCGARTNDQGELPCGH